MKGQVRHTYIVTILLVNKQTDSVMGELKRCLDEKVQSKREEGIAGPKFKSSYARS